MYLVKRDCNPGLELMKAAISLVYPARMTTSLSRSSSIRLSKVATASFPKSTPLSDINEYASSMNSTPSNALSITWLVLTAVCPTYSATRPDLSVSTKCPFLSIPRSLYIPARILATVVLPVPGLPVKTQWYDTSEVFSPLSALSFWITTKFANVRTSFFTDVSPINDVSFSIFVLPVRLLFGL